MPSAPLPWGSDQINTEAPQYAFLRQGGIYRSDVVQNQEQSQNQIPGREPTASRWSAPGPGSVGRTTSFSSSAMSSAPAIPRSGCSPALPVSASPAHAD
jgi:hypothetical protein